MTRFLDGVAANTILSLERSPEFLRVVRTPDGKIDALDQLGDLPEEQEALFAYELASRDGNVHISYRDPHGRRCGRWEAMATYRACTNPPDDATMRDNRSWAKWAIIQHNRRKGDTE
jgi:hypothetical protein